MVWCAGVVWQLCPVRFLDRVVIPMQQPVEPSPDFAQSGSADSMSVRRKSVGRSVMFLACCLLALMVFILVVGDVRSRGCALSYANEYARQLQARAAEDRVLPLDLSAAPAGGQTLRKMYRFEFLTPDEASELRSADRAIIVAQTIPVARRLASDGRAVVLYEQGLFRVEWMPLARFDAIWAVQQSEHGSGEEGGSG